MNQEQELAVLTELTRMPRTVVVVDMVESVRLIERYEEPTIRRWRTFVDEAVRLDAQPLGGRLVKSLGDGMMLEFMEPRPAVQCALAMQARLAKLNEPLSADERMDARIGIHAADVVVDKDDIYGAGVNLAARVATLAGPGEIVVTPAVRDQVVDGLDADAEDLGECYLKHLEQPVRAFRLSLASAIDRKESELPTAPNVLPVIAAIPFECDENSRAYRPVADAFIDCINAGLSKSNRWYVLSRLTCSRLRDSGLDASQLGKVLGAQFVLTGRLRTMGNKVRVAAELAEVKTNCIVWADVFEDYVGDIFASQDRAVASIVAEVSKAVLELELSRVSALSLPALEGYRVLLRGIGLMHRLSKVDFSAAESALTHLSERYPRSAEPRAWMVKWYLLKVAQRWSTDQRRDMKVAEQLATEALERSPDHALCLALDAQIQGLFNHRLDLMDAKLKMALEANSHEPVAWLFVSAMHTFRGEGEAAVQALGRASCLSPLDPMMYLFDHYAAGAYIANGDWNLALKAAERATKHNREHVPTYFWMAIAAQATGQTEKARRAVAYIRAVAPRATVRNFVDGQPCGPLLHVITASHLLREAGLA